MDELKKIVSDFIDKLKANPGALFGLLYPYILIIITVIGLYYIANLSDIAVNETSEFVPDTTEITDLPVVQARTVPPVDIFKMKEATPEMLQKGKEIFTKTCAACHNENGVGGGPASVGLNPAPRNFTSPDGWVNGRTLSGIYTTLEEGIQGSAMISYNFLTPEERISLAQYIRTEFMKDQPMDTDADLHALNSLYNLSAGMNIPAQIPVATAMEILISENSVKESKLEAVLKIINKEQAQHVVSLFDMVTYNQKTALSALINSNEWKSNQNTFFIFIMTNSTYNGFNSEIQNLSDSDINLLFNYLTRLLS